MRLLRRWAETALERLGLPDGTGVEIALTDDDTVQRLNRDYRGLDEPTDVLSFPFTDEAAPAPHYGEKPPEITAGFSVPPDQDLLGEIIISFPYAQREAAGHGHSPRKEIALLLIHGILHLLGHDHQDRVQERAMTSKTEDLLAHLN